MPAGIDLVNRVIADIIIQIQGRGTIQRTPVAILRDESADRVVVVSGAEVLQTCGVVKRLGVELVGIVVGGSGSIVAVRVIAVADLRRTRIGEQRGYVSPAVIGVVG